MSDRSDLAHAAALTAIALRKASTAAGDAGLESLSLALAAASDAHADVEAILTRAAPREPRPPEPRPAGHLSTGKARTAAAVRARAKAAALR